jgi:hypothetical protein
MSREAVRTNQQIVVKGFPWRRHRRDFVVSSALALEMVVSVTIWPLFLGIFVLVTNTYAALGVLTSLSTAVALLAIFAIGRLIDKNYGRRLLNIGAYCNMVIHLLRPFVSTPLGAVAINVVNEPTTAMYRMPFMKGVYDASDSVPGYRIAYFMLSEIVIAFFNVLFWSFLIVLLSIGSDKLALQAMFIVGALLAFVITRQRFAALQ